MSEEEVPCSWTQLPWQADSQWGTGPHFLKSGGGGGYLYAACSPSPEPLISRQLHLKTTPILNTSEISIIGLKRKRVHLSRLSLKIIQRQRNTHSAFHAIRALGGGGGGDMRMVGWDFNHG